jgi:hypothetical protein
VSEHDRTDQSEQPSRAPASLGEHAVAPAGPLVSRALFLQRAAGNAAVGRLVRSGAPGLMPGRRVLARDVGAVAAAPVTFSDPELQKIYDANKPGTLSQQVAVQLLDKVRTGPWTGLKWADVAHGMAQRVYHPEIIDQASLGTCGPAAVLNADASKDPADYVMLGIDLFETGKLKGEKVNDKLLGKSPPSGMDPSDWMLMSAIQDRMNHVFEYHGEPGWREGGSSGMMRDNLKKYAGVVDVVTNDCEMWGEIDEAKKASDYIKNNPEDVVVMMHVSADMLEDPESKENSRNHVIRLVSWIHMADDDIQFNAFTWGKYRHYKYTKAQFKRLVYAFTIGARKKGIL